MREASVLLRRVRAARGRGPACDLAGVLALVAASAGTVFAGTPCTSHFVAHGPLLLADMPGLPPLAAGVTTLRAYFGRTLAVGDFNGDAIDDLAITHRQNGSNDRPGARGSVLVLYGTDNGPDVTTAQRFNSESLLAGGPLGFGEALATGDFDGDGHDDLAIGAAGLGFPVAGTVYVLRGGAQGLDASSVQIWDRNVGSIPGTAGDEDGFGMQLVSADHNGDGYADLAIAAMKDFKTPATHQGVVHVLFGGPLGLTDAGNMALPVPGDPMPIDIEVRVSIDTNDDGIDELVVTPNASIGNQGPYACLLHPLAPGTWTRACFGALSFDITSTVHDPGGFAVGDFNGDGIDELITGENRYWQPTVNHVGRSLRWQAAITGVGIVEPAAQVLAPVFAPPYPGNANFGQNHAVADFDGDGDSDLAIGEPNWSDASVPASSGRLHVYAGSPDGLDTNSVTRINAAALASFLPPEPNLALGSHLAAGDFNGDGCPELVVATPGRAAAGVMGVGGVVILDNARDTILRDGFDP
jgi:hypothetical protein